MSDEWGGQIASLQERLSVESSWLCTDSIVGNNTFGLGGGRG